MEIIDLRQLRLEPSQFYWPGLVQEQVCCSLLVTLLQILCITTHSQHLLTLLSVIPKLFVNQALKDVRWLGVVSMATLHGIIHTFLGCSNIFFIILDDNPLLSEGKAFRTFWNKIWMFDEFSYSLSEPIDTVKHKGP